MKVESIAECDNRFWSSSSSGPLKIVFFCCTLLYALSILYCNHLDGEERELVALLNCLSGVS